MEKLYYDRENKKFYVKELDSVNNVVTDEQYVDVTDEIVTVIQEHVTKDGKKVICLDTTEPRLPEKEINSTLTVGDIGTITVSRKAETKLWLRSLIENLVWRKDYPYSRKEILACLD